LRSGENYASFGLNVASFIVSGRSRSGLLLFIICSKLRAACGRMKSYRYDPDPAAPYHGDQ
jgi:hypothetical protein